MARLPALLRSTRIETARHSLGAGVSLAGPLEPGDHVALHWGWVCDRLDARQLHNLRHYSAVGMSLANPAPTAGQ